MSRVRVLHVVEALGLGGLEQVVLSLARHASAEFTAEVLALSGGGPIEAALQAAGVRVRRLALRDYYPGSVLRAARAVRAAGPDVIHTHGHFAGVAGRLAARLAGVRTLVHHLHTCDASLRPRHRRLERLLARATRRIVCCSEAVARHARADLGAPEEIAVVVRNGIDPAPAVSREEALRLLPSGLPAPIVGCVGGLAPHKGQAVLLDAWAALPPSLRRGTLLFAGDGAERQALEAQAERLGLAPSVRFLGLRADVRSFLPAIDLLVAPSIGREGLGVAVLEAMDAGRPVIASRTGGLPEAIEEGTTGLLVPERDPQALAAAMAVLLADETRRTTLGAAGRVRVEREFRAAPMTRRIEAVYAAALEEKRAA